MFSHNIYYVFILHFQAACNIISFIPDLLTDDVDHSEIALKLCDTLTGSDEALTFAIFDALSNLCLEGEKLTEIQEIASAHLTSVSLKNMHIIVKFLLKLSTDVGTLSEVFYFYVILSPYNHHMPVLLRFYVLVCQPTQL